MIICLVNEKYVTGDEKEMGLAIEENCKGLVG